MEWIPSKGNYNTQKLWMITEEVMHNQYITTNPQKELMKLASGMGTIIQ